MSAPTGYIEVAVKDVVEKVKAMYDYKYELLCHNFANRVQDKLACPVVTGMGWWKKVRYRTIDEAWEDALGKNFYGEVWHYSLDDYWLTDDQLVRIKNLLAACRDNPDGTVCINVDQWRYVTTEPWRKEHKTPRGERE